MIPKIIHHIWPGTDPFRENFHEWRLSWMRCNPSYSFMFWNMSNMPFSRFTKAGAKMAKSDLFYLSKADLCRYEILYLFGGIYVDIDMECLESFDPLLNTDSFIGWSWPPDTVINAVMGFEPKHPILGKIIKVVGPSFRDEWEAANDPKRCYCECEGGMHKIAKNYLLKCTTLHPKDAFYPYFCTHGEELRATADLSKSYAVHHWNGMESDGWTNKK
jgi:inositol phosphorylceramide mannosyltransferase catalytic subunit